MKLAVRLLFAGLLTVGLFADGANAVVRRDIVGYWTLELQPGFNLVSFPVLPHDATPQSVIGERLGSVRISAWDRRLGGYRTTAFDPEGGAWSGDLFTLARGVAYWIRLPDDGSTQRLVVAGNPEEYTQFRWASLSSGWGFHAPVYGRSQKLSDLPPDADTDLLLEWNPQSGRYEAAVAADGGWVASGWDALVPDRAYLVHRRDRSLREIASGDAAPNPGLSAGVAAGANAPPWPLIVGNYQGLPICYESGEVCDGGMLVRLFRERVIVGETGQSEVAAENIGEYRATALPGKSGFFQISLTVGGASQFVHPGDRVYLEVTASSGASARSSSFEVPGDRQFVSDVSFPDPLLTPDRQPAAPAAFALGAPHPNPFNDRFELELRLPRSAPVKTTLYDLGGRAAYTTETVLSTGSHRLTVRPEGLAAGIYILEVRAGGNRGAAKVAYVK